MNLQEAKRDILEAGRRVYQQGYVASNDGNISCRLDDERILTTPTGMSKGFLEMSDLVVVDYEGKKVSGEKNPSSEIGMHIFLYRERPDINAVVHAHPPTATGFSVAGIPLTECVLPEVIITLGAIPIAGYGTPGGPEISEPIKKWVQDYDAYLLENHGATTIGKDVMNAYYKMETMEHFAKILFVAKQLGGANLLNEQQVADLLKIRDKMGLHGPMPACDWTPGVSQIQDPIGQAARGTNGIPTLKTKSASGNGASSLPQTGQTDPNMVDEITRRVIEELKKRT
jgi:L-fuculose-phosphate aldolase